MALLAGPKKGALFLGEHIPSILNNLRAVKLCTSWLAFTRAGFDSQLTPRIFKLFFSDF
jgi:hypothetical protein